MTALRSRLSKTRSNLSGSPDRSTSFSIASSSVKPFSCKIGANSLAICSSIRLRWIVSFSRVMTDRLKRVISKNSLISSSNRSALFNAMPVYRCRNCSDICGSSRSNDKYPITLVSGVFKSCAKYTIRSFFFCSASFTAISLRNACSRTRFNSFCTPCRERDNRKGCSG